MAHSPGRVSGCYPAAAVIGFPVGVVVVGFAVAWMLAPGGRSGAEWVRIGIALASGVLLLLPFLLGHIWLWRFRRIWTPVFNGFIDRHQKVYSGACETRPACDADFEGLDRSHYDEFTRFAQGVGFIHLGDYVLAHRIASGDRPTPLRVFAAPDGRMTVAAYHLIFVPPANAPDVKTASAETEFSDGVFLCTVCTPITEAVTYPPTILMRHLPPSTSIGDLISAHEAERTRYLDANPGVGCKTISTLDELHNSEIRQSRISADFQRHIGYLDLAHIRSRVDGPDMDQDLVERIMEIADDTRRARAEKEGRVIGK